jgi:hypothetical protein
MQQRDTPYVFGDYDDREPREGFENGDDRDAASDLETVIDDGQAMSYRSYRRRQL